MALSMSSTYTGRVVAVNDKGLRLEDHDGWLNFSKFATDLAIPERGTVVTVTTDKSGFLRSVTAVDGSALVPAQNGALRPSSAQHAGSGSSERERTISRLAILKAAAEFGASRPDLKSSDVLLIAESWETWVLRGE